MSLNSIVKGIDPVVEFMSEKNSAKNRFFEVVDSVDSYLNAKNKSEQKINEYEQKINAFKLLNPEVEIIVSDNYLQTNRLRLHIDTTPEEFIGCFSKLKPSNATFINFRTVSDHETPLFAGFFEVDTVDYMAISLEKLLVEVNRLKKVEPELDSILDKEVSIAYQIIGASRMVASSYLQSINIPFNIKGLYPFAKSQNIGVVSKLIKQYESWLDKKLESNNKIDKFLVWSSAGTIAISTMIIGLPFAVVEAAKTSIEKTIDGYMSKKNKEWEVHKVWSGKGVIPRFWNYFEHHPELNTPINFDDDSYEPISLPQTHYYPRLEFKENVYKLYLRMFETITYYAKVDVPLQNESISECRNYFLSRINKTVNIPKNNLF